MIALTPFMATALIVQEPPHCPASPEGWLTPTHAMPRDRNVNRLRVSGRTGLHWNGTPISRATLRLYLDLVRAIEPQPITLLEPAPDVNCPFREAVRAEITHAIPCAGGLCGEGNGWEYADDRPSYAPVEQAGRRSRARGSAEAERLIGEAERDLREAERQIRAAARTACRALEPAERAKFPC